MASYDYILSVECYQIVLIGENVNTALINSNVTFEVIFKQCAYQPLTVEEFDSNWVLEIQDSINQLVFQLHYKYVFYSNDWNSASLSLRKKEQKRIRCR